MCIHGSADDLKVMTTITKRYYVWQQSKNSEKAKKEVGLSGGMFPAWTHFVVAEPTQFSFLRQMFSENKLH